MWTHLSPQSVHLQCQRTRGTLNQCRPVWCAGTRAEQCRSKRQKHQNADDAGSHSSPCYFNAMQAALDSGEGASISDRDRPAIVTTTSSCVRFSARGGAQQVFGAPLPIARRNALRGTRSRRLTTGGKCARALVESKAASAFAKRRSREHVFTATNALSRTASSNDVFGIAARPSRIPHLQLVVAVKGRQAEALGLEEGLEAGQRVAVELEG